MQICWDHLHIFGNDLNLDMGPMKEEPTLLISKEIKGLVEGWLYMRVDVVLRDYEQVQQRRVERQF